LIAALLGTAAMVAGSAWLVRLVPLRLAIVVASAFLALPGLVAALFVTGSLLDTLCLRGVRARAVALAMAAGLGLWVASLGVLELQYFFWAPPPGYLEGFRSLHEALRPKGPLDGLWSLVAIAIAPAVFEEILVRGLVLPALRPSIGDAAAVAVSALFFAVMHFDGYRFVFTLTVGAALGILRLRTGSLWPSILAHATLNGLTFVAAPWLDDPTAPLPDPRPGVGLALLAAGAVVSFFAFRHSRRTVFDSPGTAT
jgi:membrane protease YdiL (CAAX protease family)